MDLREVDKRKMELTRMFLLLQREIRKEVLGGTSIKSYVIVVTSWHTLHIIVLGGRRRRRRNRRGPRQLLQQPWQTLLPSMKGNFLWIL
jgi:hypothetical protein